MGDAISAQGTIIERDPLGAGAFAAIAELRDISGPALSRNPIETTNHNDPDENFVVGIRRYGEVTFTIGYIPTNASHKSGTGLIGSWENGDRDVFRITYPDGSSWVFSGFISNFGANAPLDDGLTADVSIRTTGGMIFND
jgi:hypothetical protein